MDDNKNQEVEEKKQAGQNTAHVAGRVASRYFGGNVGGKVYDVASKTKLGKSLEKGVGNVIAKSPVGNINKKVNDTGAVNMADKAIDALDGKNSLPTSKNGLNLPNPKDKGDVPEALKKSRSNLAFYNRNKQKSENSEEDKDEANENSSDNKEGKTKEEIVDEKKIKIIKKMLPFIAGAAIFLFFILIIIALLNPIIGTFSGFISAKHSTDNINDYAIYNQNDANYALEKAYNEAILGSSDGSVKGIVKEYQEKYGVTIDWYLLNAVITYRYVLTVDSDLYTDNNYEVDEAEIEERINELDAASSDDDNSSDDDSSPSIDYDDAKKRIVAVATLMVSKENGVYTADSSVGGAFYNRLIDSGFLKSYYKDYLHDNSYDERKKLVDEIFEYASNAKELLEEDESPINGGVVNGDTSVVYLQSCTKPSQYNVKNIGPYKVYDNELVNEGSNYPLYLSLRDYVKGVVYRENFLTDEKYRESIKVQAIMALSFLLHDSRSGFDMKNGEMYFPTETCRQATCDPNYGCTSISGVASYSGTDRGIDGTHHRALNEKEQAYLDSILDEVFGLILVNKGVTASTFSGSSDIISFNYCNTLGECSSCHSGSCVGQQESNNDAASGMDYKAIFAKYFSSLNYDIINITEGLYYQSSGENFSGSINLNEEFHYHQSDSPWGKENLCDSGSISANGCNITSAAIVISLLKNQRITPDALNSRQNENQFCNQSSRPQMIQKFGELYGLNVEIINKGNKEAVQDMTKKIATGNYAAVARIAPNSGVYQTSSGHYVTIVGARSEGENVQLLVWDPATTDSSRDNVWIDANDLIKYLQPEYSFILMGR